MSRKRLGQKERAMKTTLTPKQALYHAVRDFPGGTKVVAATYGVNEIVLNNKLNLNQTTHKMNIDDIEVVWGCTKDPRITEAFGAMFGGIFVPLPKQMLGTSEIVSDMAELATRVADMSKDVAAAIADGVVDSDELDTLRADLLRLIKAGAQIVLDAENFNEQNDS